MYTRYEERVIKGLIGRFPDLADALSAIIGRLVDLAPLVEQHFYAPPMAGSWSIKAIVAAIAPDMDYNILVGIQEGTAASEGYLEAIDPETTELRRAQLKEQLLQYCRFDTEAMVRLTDFLSAGESG
jgi:predicted RecB family nuclease